MIKAENGTIEISGDPSQLLTDLTFIVSSLRRSLKKRFSDDAIELFIDFAISSGMNDELMKNFYAKPCEQDTKDDDFLNALMAYVKENGTK